jgi:transposase
MNTFMVGIDISKDKFDAAFLDGERWRERTFPNASRGHRALAAWLRRHAGGVSWHACMEATGRYAETLAGFLHAEGFAVSVVNPAQVKAFGQSELLRAKTDAADARLIARFAAAHRPRPWTPAPPEQKKLQALMRHRDALLADRRRHENRLEGADPFVAASIRRVVKGLDKELRAVEREVRRHLAAHPPMRTDAELLATIPGVGATTAALILAEAPALRSLPDARALAAFAGLVPRHRQSGSSVRGRSRLAKTGNARLRRALYMPAVVAMKCNPLLRPFAQRLREAGKPMMAVVAAVMRKILHLAYGVLKHQKPFDPQWAHGGAR